LKLFGKDLDKEVAIVAEIGQNHEGDIDRAKRLIELAKEAGADAVKFQSFTPEKLYPESMPERLARAKKHALSTTEQIRLSIYAEAVEIPWFSTPVQLDWVDFLEHEINPPAFKIASGDITNTELLEAVAATGKPVILSTGGATWDELVAASVMFLPSRLVVMHCSAAYPPPMDQLNLTALRTITKQINISPLGYSCHIPDIDVCIAAVALGARVLEVHFTDLGGDARSQAEFHDHRVSFNKWDFIELRRRVDRINEALGDGIKRPMPCEQPFLDLMHEIGRR